MGRLSATLLPPKRRLQDLQEQITLLQGQLRAGRGIAVLEVARCGHDDCGPRLPEAMPEDALILELGCEHQIPEAPALEQPQHQSRGDRRRAEEPLGRGIGTERKKRLLKTIRLL